MKLRRRRCAVCREPYRELWMFRTGAHWLCFPTCNENARRELAIRGEPKPREGRKDISLAYNPNPNTDWSG